MFSKEWRECESQIFSTTCRAEKNELNVKRTSWIGRSLQRHGSCETDSDTNIKVKFQCPMVAVFFF